MKENWKNWSVIAVFYKYKIYCDVTRKNFMNLDSTLCLYTWKTMLERSQIEWTLQKKQD